MRKLIYRGFYMVSGAAGFIGAAMLVADQSGAFFLTVSLSFYLLGCAVEDVA